MFNENMINTLLNSLPDEYNDVLKYMRLAKEAGDNEAVAQVLSDIAYEEYIHAKHIKEILKGCKGVNVDTPELKELKDKAKKVLMSE